MKTPTMARTAYTAFGEVRTSRDEDADDGMKSIHRFWQGMCTIHNEDADDGMNGIHHYWQGMWIIHNEDADDAEAPPDVSRRHVALLPRTRSQKHDDGIKKKYKSRSTASSALY